MKRMIRATSERKHDPRMYSDEGYWFSTTHGIQPGSIPRDVEILDTYYGRNKSFVKLNRFLTTEELNFYDMKEEVPGGSINIDEDLEDVTGAVKRVDDKVPDLALLEEEIREGVAEYMTSPDGGFDVDEVDDYSVVETRDEGDRYEIEVRAELSYDGFITMLNEYLDNIVQKYDPNAYFEMDSPGIAVCVIWKEDE